MSIRRGQRPSCVGTSTLEFIVILPFLLILMLVAVELSRALATYNVVVQASREGARQAVVTSPFAAAAGVACSPSPPPATSPAGRACGILTSVPSINPAATNVTVSCAGTGSGGACTFDNQVTVTVTTTFTSIFADFFAFVGGIGAWWGVPAPPLLAPGGFSMPHTTKMRYE